MWTTKIFIMLSVWGIVESMYTKNIKMCLYWLGALLINISLELS